MKNNVLAGLVFCFISNLCSGQTPMAFEVASVKPAPPPTPGRFSVRVSDDAGRVTYTNVSLRMIIARAYKVKEHQIAGPDWLNSERFDVSATFPEGAKKDDIPEMLRTLLMERFKMTAHKEEKNAPVYALVVGKGGIKVKPAEPDANAPPPSPSTSGGNTNFAATRGPMGKGMRVMMGPKNRKMSGDSTFAQLADFLSNSLDRPVIDETKTTEKYAIQLEWTPDASENRGMMGPIPMMPRPPAPSGEKSIESDGPDAPGIFTAVQEQLGVRLEPKKGLLETVVIDKIEKLPTEN